MTLLTGLIPTALDPEGRTYPNAKLYSYYVGTNTPKPTYFNKNFTVENSNPVVADGAGIFFKVFLNGAYRLKLVDKYDTVIWTQNNYNSDSTITDGDAEIFYQNNAASVAGAYVIDAPDNSTITDVYIDGMIITWRPSHLLAAGSATINIINLDGLPVGAVDYVLPNYSASLADGYLSDRRDYKARYDIGLNAFVDIDFGAFIYNAGVQRWSDQVCYDYAAGTYVQDAGLLWRAVSSTTPGAPVQPSTDASYDYWIPENAISSVRDKYRSVNISATGANSMVSVIAKDVCMEAFPSSYSRYCLASDVTETIDMTASGVNGLDTGTVAANTWYYVHLIGTYEQVIVIGSFTQAIASLSESTPALPAGYIYSAKIGSFKTDGTANKYPLKFTNLNGRCTWGVLSADLTGGVSGAGATVVLQAPPRSTAAIVVSATGAGYVLVTSTDQTNSVPAAGLYNAIGTAAMTTATTINVDTSGTSEIRYRTSAPTVDIFTTGWIEP